MLGDKPIDVEATESALGYRLRQHHLGVVAWSPTPSRGSDGLTRLDRLTSAAARRSAPTAALCSCPATSRWPGSGSR